MSTNEKLAQALRNAIRQNEHDMLLTGEELREAHAALAAHEAEQAAASPLKAEIARLTEQAEKDKERIRELEAAINKFEGMAVAAVKFIEVLEKHENAKRAPVAVRAQPRPTPQPQPAPQPKYDTLDHISGVSAMDFIIDMLSGKKGGQG